MRLLLRAFPIITVLSIFSFDLFAQTGPGVCFPPPCVPVSDHIGWLLAAAVIFGIFKSIQYSRNSSKA